MKVFIFIIAFFLGIQYTIQGFFDLNECDLVLDAAVCIRDGERIVLPPAKPKGLVAHWSFEDSKILDYSGKRNHALNTITVSSGFGGRGYAAHFNGFDYVEVPHSESLSLKTYSISLWAFFIKNADEAGIIDITLVKEKKGIRWCPIFQKGVDDNFEKIYFRAPGIFYDRHERHLRAFISTSENIKYAMGESVTSKSKVPYSKWTHIAVIRDEKNTKLYINGILDGNVTSEGWTILNDMPMYIGNTPWHKEDCNVPSLLDEIRIYDRPLSEEEIEAEASFALGSIEPSFIKLGCLRCSIEVASTKCPDRYHICSTIELYTGGFQIARTMGWIEYDTNIWSHSQISKFLKEGSKDQDTPDSGVVICCQDLN